MRLLRGSLKYWTALLLSVPGNPCGVGSAGIQTELILPHDTAGDRDAALTPAVGRRLGLRGRTPLVARASGRCAAGAKGATLVLKPSRALLAKLAQQRKPLAATLTAKGATRGGAKVAAKLGYSSKEKTALTTFVRISPSGPSST